MATGKEWREMTKGQKDTVKKRWKGPYVRLDNGNPMVYYWEKGKLERRRPKFSFEAWREMEGIAQDPRRALRG